MFSMVLVGDDETCTCRKVSDHRFRTGRNGRALRRWLSDPWFDPVYEVWHEHDANWSSR